jgi:hypothetical protein
LARSAASESSGRCLGFGDSAHLNTAIALPIGVEAYGSYALAAWLDSGTPTAARGSPSGAQLAL